MKNILNSLCVSTKNVYTFTAFAKIRCDKFDYLEGLVQMNAPSVVNFIDRSTVIDLQFANFSRLVHHSFMLFLGGKVSHQCEIEKHKIYYSEEQIGELLSLPHYTSHHYNILKK